MSDLKSPARVSAPTTSAATTSANGDATGADDELNVAARRGEREATFAVVVAILAVVAAVIAGALAVRAIRDDDTAGARSRGNGASTVDVTLTEFAITPAEITVGAGGALRVTNDGSIEHNLAVEGADLRTPMLGAGASATLELGALAPGTYALLCEVGGHAGAGMSGKLIVTEGGSGSDVPAAGGGDPDWAAMDKAMTESMLAFPATTEGKGAQVLAPTVLPNGIKQFEVTAAITEWEVSPGQLVEAWTYNGQVPGPTLRVAVGDEIQVVVRNDLPMGTDVHWHGVETPNEMDGVAPITQKLIGPGETFVYTFTATEPAVGMYHAHHHAQMQVINGMLGALIVGDLELPRGQTISGEAIPADLQVSQEFPLVLNDAGVIGLSLNGKSFPATEPVAAKLGDWLLVHYMNEGLQSHPMHLHQMEQLVVAKDGIPLDNPYFADTINVAPGERYSVLVHADSVGTWVWHCHILNHVEQEDGMFGMVTAMVVTP